MYKVKTIFLQYSLGEEISDEDIKEHPNWEKFCEKIPGKKVEAKVADKPKQKTKKSKK